MPPETEGTDHDFRKAGSAPHLRRPPGQAAHRARSPPVQGADALDAEHQVHDREGCRSWRHHQRRAPRALQNVGCRVRAMAVRHQRVRARRAPQYEDSGHAQECTAFGMKYKKTGQSRPVFVIGMPNYSAAWSSDASFGITTPSPGPIRSASKRSITSYIA